MFFIGCTIILGCIIIAATILVVGDSLVKCFARHNKHVDSIHQCMSRVYLSQSHIKQSVESINNEIKGQSNNSRMVFDEFFSKNRQSPVNVESDYDRKL